MKLFLMCQRCQFKLDYQKFSISVKLIVSNPYARLINAAVAVCSKEIFDVFYVDKPHAPVLADYFLDFPKFIILIYITVVFKIPLKRGDLE